MEANKKFVPVSINGGIVSVEHMELMGLWREIVQGAGLCSRCLRSSLTASLEQSFTGKSAADRQSFGKS